MPVDEELLQRVLSSVQPRLAEEVRAHARESLDSAGTREIASGIVDEAAWRDFPIASRIDLDDTLREATETITESLKRAAEARAAVRRRAADAISGHRANLVFGDRVGGLLETVPPKLTSLPSGGYRASGGEYSQRYEFGGLTFQDMHYDEVKIDPYYTADIVLAAIKCFGTDDHSTDEPYLIATLLNDAAPGTGDPERFGQTYTTGVTTGVQAGRIFAENALMFRNVVVGRHGIWVKLSLFDHEHGSPDEVRNEYQKWANAASKDAEKAAKLFEQGGAAEEAAGAFDESSLGDLLASTFREIVVGLLDDDAIDEKNWLIPAAWIRHMADAGLYTTSGVTYPPRELPVHIDTNFPYEGIFDGTRLFSNGDASYKVYLRVVPFRHAPTN